MNVVKWLNEKGVFSPGWHSTFLWIEQAIHISFRDHSHYPGTNNRVRKARSRSDSFGCDQDAHAEYPDYESGDHPISD
jgi:hypothetical protein